MRKALIFLSLCCPVLASAHDFLTEILAYNSEYGYNPYHVAVSYDLSEKDLVGGLNISRSKFEMDTLTRRSSTQNKRKEYQKVGRTDCDFESGSLNKTCGVFDHFNAARAAAVDRCNAYALLHQADYPHGLIPQFTGPATFTDGVGPAANHHDDYRFVHGLSFNCVVLVSKKPAYQINN